VISRGGRFLSGSQDIEEHLAGMGTAKSRLFIL
jgi:hypothetical protein